MTALVDRLRALGPVRARRVIEDVERDSGPAAVASLRYDPRFWLREQQVVEPPYATIELFVGERGTGKSHGARELFVKLLPQTERPRIVTATDAAIYETVFDGESGLTRWTAPHVRCQYRESKGYAGDILYGNHRIVCMSAAGPVGAIGTGYGLTWADDIAAWIEAVGEARAASVWNHVLKSNRAKPGIIIVTTTGRAAEFLFRLMDTDENKRTFADTRIHDLGKIENNEANLTRRFANIVKGLRAADEWEEGGDPTGAFSKVDWPSLRVRTAPRIVRILVCIDPAKSSRSTSCEVGIVAVGIDDRDVVYGLADASGVLSALTWPSVAHDLLEQMRAEYRGARVGFLVENNAGGEMPLGLLVAEDKIRNLRERGRAISTAEIEEVTSRPRDSKTKRAGPVVAMAGRGGVLMLYGLGVLEGQLSKLTDAAPGNDRADAFVHGARSLAGILDEKERERAADDEASRSAFAGFAEAQLRMPAPSYGSPIDDDPSGLDEWDRV